jgi:excisionase family DNA binding protein
MPLISAQEAASRLGINAQRVRALAGQGRLPAHKVANRWLFDSELLRDNEARPRSDGRPFSQRHALALLYLASGEAAPWVSDYDIWRLRRYLPKLAQLVPRLRLRGRVGYYSAPDSLLRRLGADAHMPRSGVSAAERYGADISARNVLEIYALDDVDRLRHRYALREVAEAGANLIIHWVRIPDALTGRRAMPIGVVAVDLLDSSDSRTQRAGRALIQRLARR